MISKQLITPLDPIGGWLRTDTACHLDPKDESPAEWWLKCSHCQGRGATHIRCQWCSGAGRILNTNPGAIQIQHNHGGSPGMYWWTPVADMKSVAKGPLGSFNDALFAARDTMGNTQEHS